MVKKVSKQPSVEAALLDREDLAAYLNVSLSSVDKMNAYGQLPIPIKLGRSTRWRKEEIDQWLNAGSPPRTKWERLKGRCA